MRAMSSHSTAPTHQEDHEKHEGKRIEDIDDPHHDGVGPPAEISRHGAVGDADNQRHAGGEQPDHQRYATGDQRAGEEVAAVGVGAEQEALPVEVGREHHTGAVGRALDDLGVREQVGAVEIAGDARVDRLLCGEGDGQPVPGQLPALDLRAGPAQRPVERRLDGLGLRIGREACRHLHVVAVHLVVAVRRQPGSNDAGERDQRQDHDAGHRRTVRPEPQPGVAPQRAALDGRFLPLAAGPECVCVSHSHDTVSPGNAPWGRAGRRADRRSD
jgi:hypothetical protein